jgi:hypothetical protein
MKVVFLASIATEEYKLKNNDFDISKTSDSLGIRSSRMTNVSEDIAISV